MKKKDILKITKEVDFVMDNIGVFDLSEFGISIVQYGNVLYNSGKSLNRSLILFTPEGREVISDTVVPGEYFLYSPDTSSFSFDGKGRRIGPHLISVMLREGDCIRTSSRIIFCETVNCTHAPSYFIYHSLSGIRYEKNGKEYQVIEGRVLYLLSEDGIESDLAFLIGDVIMPLSQLLNHPRQGRREYDLTSLIPSENETEVILFSIHDNQRKDKISIIRFDSGFLSYDKSLYYKDQEHQRGILTLKLGNREFVESFSIVQSSNSIPFHEGTFFYEPPKLTYQIDKQEKKDSPVTFFFEDINNASRLTLSLPDQLSYSFSTTTGNTYRQEGNTIFIGETIYHLASLEKWNETTLFLSVGGQLYELLHVFLKPHAISAPLTIIPDLFRVFYDASKVVKPQKGNIIFRLKTEDKTYPDIFLRDSGLVTLPDSLADDFYTISLWYQSPGFVKKEALLCEQKNVFLGNRNTVRFKGKLLVIDCFYTDSSKYPMRMQKVYLKHLNYVGRPEGFDIYTGNLYMWSRKLERWINVGKIKEQAIRPVRIEIVNDNICYLGYAWDKETNDFDEFIISKEGRLTVGTTKGDCQIPDRFQYTVKEDN